MWTTSDFRKGLKIEIDGVPYVIVDFQHVKPGKGTAFVRTRIKNMITGQLIEPTFRSGDKVKRPDLLETKMQYLYSDGDTCHFMDTKSYEQAEIPREILGEASDYLIENLEISAIFFNGQPIGVDVPNFVELKIIRCEPGARGDTVSGAQKPATVETGAIFYVPLFVNEGETIRVDTRDRSYVERVSK
ncbi:MAG: elongation factor P [Deltaproteobacteria bacterium]|nr:elongation factor P [Deltaproteobacteria bacterium]